MLQVSPAKLALRRHLSQEKLAANQHTPQVPVPNCNLVATRTIGDLVSGEIERTLEISNQVLKLITIIYICYANIYIFNSLRKNIVFAFIVFLNTLGIIKCIFCFSS